MNEKIENLLKEDRKFPPSEHLVKNANAPSSWYDEANEDRLKFWQKQALSRISWFKEPTEILDDSNPPFFKWFKDGELNLSYNCLDRHLESDGDRVAFYWEGEPGDTQEITYQDLYERVCKLSNALKKLGVEKGDRVAIYLGMTPEIVVSMLACARIGAVHSVVFGGFSSEALADRINDAKAKTVITADGAWRRGDIVPLKNNVDGSLELTEYVENVIVVKRTEQEINMTDGRDHWYHDITDKESSDCEPEVMNSEDMLYILYTSGTTGDPKGALLPHRTLLGHLPGVEMPHEFLSSDLSNNDCFWTPADWAWIGGLFDVLLPSLYFGIPVLSHRSSKFDPEFTFDLMEKFEVKNTFLPPTSLKMMKSFNLYKSRDKLNLRTVGSGGEALGEELLNWGKEILNVGINEFYGQTECNLTVSNNGLIMKQKLGSIGRPVPGHKVKLMKDDGTFISKSDDEGEIVVKSNSPSIFSGYWNNDKETQTKIIDGWLHTGDYATVDDEGYFYFKGRKDDLINRYLFAESSINQFIEENSFKDLNDINKEIGQTCNLNNFNSFIIIFF